MIGDRDVVGAEFPLGGEVRLEIGELVVSGVDVTHPHRLGPGVEAALTALLRDRGVPSQWSTGERVDVTDAAPSLRVRLDRVIDAELLAQRLALAVYDGLSAASSERSPGQPHATPSGTSPGEPRGELVGRPSEPPSGRPSGQQSGQRSEWPSGKASRGSG